MDPGPASNRNANRRGLPTSGSEPVFDEDPWSTENGVTHNNCYSYAMDNFESKRRTRKAVPGDRAGLGDLPDGPLSCKPLHKRVLQDNPASVYAAGPRDACKPGFYKVMMFIDADKEYGDFHFYKQHRHVIYRTVKGDTLRSIAKMFRVTVAYVRAHNKRRLNAATSNAETLRPGTRIALPRVNVWSHKLGHATGALLLDSCGKVITDPRDACRSYSHTYKDYCGSFCAKKGSVRTGVLD